jgi:hypothetical protein
LLVTPGAYPRRKHLKVAPIGLALALPSNSKTWLERVSRNNRSSIFGLFVSDKVKELYNVDFRLHPSVQQDSWRKLHFIQLDPDETLEELS